MNIQDDFSTPHIRHTVVVGPQGKTIPCTSGAQVSLDCQDQAVRTSQLANLRFHPTEEKFYDIRELPKDHDKNLYQEVKVEYKNNIPTSLKVMQTVKRDGVLGFLGVKKTSEEIFNLKYVGAAQTAAPAAASNTLQNNTFGVQFSGSAQAFLNNKEAIEKGEMGLAYYHGERGQVLTSLIFLRPPTYQMKEGTDHAMTITADDSGTITLKTKGGDKFPGTKHSSLTYDPSTQQLTAQ